MPLTIRQLRSFSLALLGFSTLTYASGCPTQIKNVEVCADKGRLGAVCAYWHNAKGSKRNIPKHEWDQLRIGMFCTSPQGQAHINALIERLCQNQTCVLQTNELIGILQGGKK